MRYIFEIPLIGWSVWPTNSEFRGLGICGIIYIHAIPIVDFGNRESQKHVEARWLFGFSTLKHVGSRGDRSESIRSFVARRPSVRKHN